MPGPTHVGGPRTTPGSPRSTANSCWPSGGGGVNQGVSDQSGARTPGLGALDAPTAAVRPRLEAARWAGGPHPPPLARSDARAGQLCHDGDGVGVGFDQPPEDQITLGLRAQPVSRRAV